MTIVKENKIVSSSYAERIDLINIDDCRINWKNYFLTKGEVGEGIENTLDKLSPLILLTENSLMWAVIH